jgi:hypothetical protein
MKKSILRAVFPIVLGLVLLLVGTGTKAYSAGFLSFEIKLSGGAGYLFNGGGDLESSRVGWQNYAIDWADSSYYTQTFDWKKVSIAPDFRGEFILKFGNYLGVGFGAGYQSMTSTANISLMFDRTYTYWWGDSKYNDDDVFIKDYKITNIPIFMNIYGYLPLRNMSLFAYIGPSINIGSLTHTMTEAYTELWDETSWFYWNQSEHYAYNATQTDTLKCTAFGFQGGLGIQINLSSFLAIGIEAYGRYVNFSNWTGTSNYSWNSKDEFYYEPWGWWLTVNHSGTDNFPQATLYDYDWLWSYTGSNYNVMDTYETGDPPTGSTYSNVHTAAINFNAIGGLFSIIIHF